MDDCTVCGGSGQVEWGCVASMGGVGGFVMQHTACTYCHGTGVYLNCYECCDTGEVALEQNPDGTWNLDGAFGPCHCMETAVAA